MVGARRESRVVPAVMRELPRGGAGGGGGGGTGRSTPHPPSPI